MHPRPAPRTKPFATDLTIGAISVLGAKHGFDIGNLVSCAAATHFRFRSHTLKYEDAHQCFQWRVKRAALQTDPLPEAKPDSPLFRPSPRIGGTA